MNLATTDWQFWIDVGGTFTDCLARRPDGVIVAHKLLSTGVYAGAVAAGSSSNEIVDPLRRADPDGFFVGFTLIAAPSDADGASWSSRVVGFDAARGALQVHPALPAAPPIGTRYELSCGLEAPVVGIRRLLARPPAAALGAVRVRLGTTRGTNALLERRVAPTALATTRGFADILRIGDQARPKLFELHVRKPAPLYRTVVEIDERVDAAGRVLRGLDETAAREALRAARDAGAAALAVCLLNSYRNAAHEQRVAALAREVGFAHVSVSSWLAPLQRIVPRAETTVVDAALSPIVTDYVERLRAQMPEAKLHLMTSAGALVAAERFVAKDSLLSGPAGGAVGAARVARAAGFERAIGFDMGGTSTDVSRYDGRFERRSELHIEDRASGGATRVFGDMIAIETVAAGGGSICDFDGAHPTVGPRSAGADPGPACYGRGGPLCITDCNLLLGRVNAARFPFPLDRAAAERCMDERIATIADTLGRVYRREELAAGYVAIANAHMTAAIRQASVRRGYDPREYPLVSFGGAAGQHACAVAGALGMRAIVIHPCASLLSAYGVGAAEIARFAACDIGARLDDATLERVRREFAVLEASLGEVLRTEAPRGATLVCRRRLELRYVGQDEPLAIDEPADGDWRLAFERAHQRLYGFTHRERPVEVRAARCELAAQSALSERETFADDPDSAATWSATEKLQPADATERTRVYLGSAWIDAAVWRRAAMRAGAVIQGPALIVDAHSSVVLEGGWCAALQPSGALLLNCESPDRPPAAPAREPRAAGASDPIELQLLRGALDSVAEEMGAALRRTALSTNVKERLDYSCAVYSAQAELVAHAAHIPVHIGAMEDCVRCLVADVGAERLRTGSSFATNHPYRGGSHLPDVTVVTPVLDAAGAVRFFVANRAHHAEIGGIAPGSMPADSRSLADEGVLLQAFELVDGAGHFREVELRATLTRGPHPSRSPEQNIADLRAQLAANQAGVARLRALSQLRTPGALESDLQQLLADAERRTRAALRRLGLGERRFVDHLDDGTPIALRLVLADEAATFDFSGSGGVLAGNLNATPAIVRSAVLYCVRCLAANDLSLNAGVARAVRIVLPECLLNPPLHPDPARCPAVAGGNVETSQRIVDVILGAFGVVAASQGTMNNLSFGDATFGYYETLAGGGGAGPGFDGADAVHTHMTNTRLTDVEVLEERYPVRVRRLAIRRGSGGVGRWRGGDGLVREIEFVAPVRVALLTQRRTLSPYGVDGGGAGCVGANWLRSVQGGLEPLPAIVGFAAQPGDSLMVETPGGGGCGVVA